MELGDFIKTDPLVVAFIKLVSRGLATLFGCFDKRLRNWPGGSLFTDVKRAIGTMVLVFTTFMAICFAKGWSPSLR